VVVLGLVDVHKRSCKTMVVVLPMIIDVLG
jgi:hypothetical protein